MSFTTLAADTQNALASLAKAVSVVHPLSTYTLTFNSGALTPQREPVELFEEIATWEAAEPGRYIYYIETDNDTTALTQLSQAFRAAREKNLSNRKYSRPSGPSQVLYVGGSSSLATRFRQHLGFGNKSVYAMQLAYWANVVDVPMRFIVARYAPTLSVEVHGALEDQLWSQLRPMMGRQGRK